MKEIASLMNYRDSIKVVDATLRDGGLVNDFFFDDKFVHDLYLANIKAGVDYMEFGYKGDKEMFDRSKFGKWKFCDDDDIRAIVGENDTDLKIAVMADVGRCSYKQDILPRSESVIDLIRVATYLNQIPTAVDMIEDAKNKGYEVSCNIMAISSAQEGDVRTALDILGKTPVDVIYIVDSFGALYPEQMQRVAALYVEYAEKYGKKIGIHAHNNQQLAFANTIEAVATGADWLDGTYDGMGRGAGNCPMEHLLGFLRNPKYKLYPVVQFVEKYMEPLRASGITWGPSLAYLLTGIFNQHPRAAIAYTKAGRSDICSFFNEISGQD